VRRLHQLVLLSLLSLPACGDDGPKGPSKDQITIAQGHWLGLSNCLLGGRLPEGTNASAALRAIDLTLVLQGTGKDGVWTKACGKVADGLVAQLRTFKEDASVEKYGPLISALEELKDTTPEMLAATSEPVIDRVWKEAGDVGLDPIPDGVNAVDGPTAPTPSRPMDIEDLTKLGVSKGFIERRDRAPGGSVRFVLGSKDTGAFHCHLGSGNKPLDHARCTALSADVGVAATPLSAQKESDEYYWDSDPKPSAWSVGGETLKIPIGPSGFVYQDGTIVDAVPSRRGAELVRKLTKGKLQRAPVKAPPGATFIGFRGGAMLWRGPLRGASGRRPVMVQDVSSGRAGLGGSLDVGEIPRDAKHPLACRIGDDLHIVLIGEDPKPGKEKEERGIAWLVRHKRRWKKPVRLDVKFGQPVKPFKETWWRSISCDEKGVTMTWLRDDRRVGQLRCADRKCAAAVSDPIAPLSKSEKLRAVSVADKILLVRTVRAVAPCSGLTDLVAMRLAPVGEIATAKDRVLVGDEKYGGVPNLHKSIGLLASGDAAVALIHSGENVYGLRIDADGAVSKLGLGAPLAADDKAPKGASSATPTEP
jgi:hypothetical protein